MLLSFWLIYVKLSGHTSRKNTCYFHFCIFLYSGELVYSQRGNCYCNFCLLKILVNGYIGVKQLLPPSLTDVKVLEQENLNSFWKGILTESLNLFSFVKMTVKS